MNEELVGVSEENVDFVYESIVLASRVVPRERGDSPETAYLALTSQPEGERREILFRAILEQTRAMGYADGVIEVEDRYDALDRETEECSNCLICSDHVG